MKIKLTNQELSLLEVLVLDSNISKYSNSIKNKFLYAISTDEKLVFDLSNDEYLFLLDNIEEINSEELVSVYHNLVIQDKLDIIKPYSIDYSII